MYCPKCGMHNADGATSCVRCNERMDEAPAYAGLQPAYDQAQQPAFPQSLQQQGYQEYYQQGYQQGQQYPPYAPTAWQTYYNQPNPTLYGVNQVHPGDSAGTVSLVCGILGLFFFGVVLGVIAIVQGSKAKKLGYTGPKATAGIVLGVVDVAFWAIIIFFIVVAAIAASTYAVSTNPYPYYYW